MIGSRGESARCRGGPRETVFGGHAASRPRSLHFRRVAQLKFDLRLRALVGVKSKAACFAEPVIGRAFARTVGSQRRLLKLHAPIASLIFFRVNGKSRSRFPVPLPMAFAIDPAAGPCPVSPLPRKGWPRRLMMCTSMLSGTELKRRIG